MMKRLIALLLAMMSLSSLCVYAEGDDENAGLVKRDPLLDAAFSMLEAGNPFLVRYNELTGSGVEAVFELGAPYFFGGKHDYESYGEPHMYLRLPDYAKRKCWETTHFYRKNAEYLYGFDCSGFTQWVYSELGWPEHPALDQMILNYGKYGKKNHIFTHRKGQEMPPWDELASHLVPGDLLVGKLHGARHVMMFCGTLRDFGYTAEEVPELAPYLDYALVIHCGPNFAYTTRIQARLDAQTDPYYDGVLTTDGGVAVSIIGVPFADAPHQEHFGVTDFAWFDLPDGTPLTIWDLPSCTSFCWFRWNFD